MGLGERYLLAIIGKIDAQIHEVVLAPTGLVHDGLEHGLVDLVGDVPEHDLGPPVSIGQRLLFRVVLTVVRTSMPSRMRLTSTWLW